MKKTVFQCVGNVFLFTFLGLAFLYPFSEVVQFESGFGGSVSVFAFLLIAYLILYPAIYFILAKKYRWGKGTDSELAYSDEREKIIVAESTKAVYKVLIGGLMFVITAIGGVRLFSLSTGVEISIYTTSIALLTVLLNIATVLYCVKWCQEYKK